MKIKQFIAFLIYMALLAALLYMRVTRGQGEVFMCVPDEQEVATIGIIIIQKMIILLPLSYFAKELFHWNDPWRLMALTFVFAFTITVVVGYYLGNYDYLGLICYMISSLIGYKGMKYLEKYDIE